MAGRTGLPLITRLPPRRRPWWPRAAVFSSRQVKAKHLKYRGFSLPPGLQWKAFGRTWPASTAWCRRSIKELAKVGNDTTFELPLGGAWSGPIGTGRLIPLIIGRDGAREGQRVTNNNTPSGRQLALGNETKQSSAIARRSQWWRRRWRRRPPQQAAASQSQSPAQSKPALRQQRARRPGPRQRPPGVRSISGAGPRGGDVG